MRLVAQRVRNPSTHQEGCNAYFVTYDEEQWLDPPPDNKLGKGVRKNALLDVPGTGNRVRSFLDIVAPLSKPLKELRQMIYDSSDLLAGTHEKLPWSAQYGDVRFTFNAERGLIESDWWPELRYLLDRCIKVRLKPPGAGSLGGDIFSGKA